MTAPSSRPDVEARRCHLVDAAGVLFARSGLQVTQAQIAEAAGIGVASLYRLFTTKDELILRVYESRLREAVEIATAACAVADPWDGLVMFLRRSADELARDLGFRELILGGHGSIRTWSRRETEADLGAALRASDDLVAERLGDVIRRAQHNGDLRLDFAVTDVQLIAAAVQSSAAFGGEENPALYQRTLGFLLDGLRPPRPGSAELAAGPLDRDQLDRITARSTTDG